jgi:hypothetical protein
MAIFEIRKTPGDTIVQLNDLTKNTGTYVVKYSISIKINGIPYSKKINQNVTVN